MTLRESALVAFTLLMQTSVGVVLVVTALHPFVSRGSAQPAVRAFDLPLLVAACAAALGLVASLAHLGQPLQAWLAIANVRTSWLSREIVAALLFTAAVSVAAAVFRAGTASATPRVAACGVAVALGVAALYAMSRLYMVPAQPAWNRIATPLGFFATSLVLGTIVVLVTHDAARLEPSPGPYAPSALSWVRLLVLVAIAFLVAQLLLLPAQIAAVPREPAAAIAASAGALAGWLAVVRAALALGAVAVLATMLRAGAGHLPAASGLIVLLLVAASEILGRILFYAGSVRL